MLVWLFSCLIVLVSSFLLHDIVALFILFIWFWYCYIACCWLFGLLFVFCVFGWCLRVLDWRRFALLGWFGQLVVVLLLMFVVGCLLVVVDVVCLMVVSVCYCGVGCCV